MRVRYAETTPTPVHAVKVGDHLMHRRTGEVRRVDAIARTLTERRLILDDGSYIDTMFLNMVAVTREPVSDVEVGGRDA